MDRLILSGIFNKSIFEKAWTVNLSDEPILPNEIDAKISNLRAKLRLYNYIPKYNSPIVNRQWWPRFSVPLNGSLTLSDEQSKSPTFLLFNSRFESGNLERAYKIEEIYKIPELSIRKSGLSKTHSSSVKPHSRHTGWGRQNVKNEARYDLYLTPDWSIGKKPNKNGEYTKMKMTKHTQWFYFSTRNFSNEFKVTFAIKNLYKKSSAYSKGMQPFVFSLKKHKKTGIGWHRGWDLVRYTQVRLYNLILNRILIIQKGIH